MEVSFDSYMEYLKNEFQWRLIAGIVLAIFILAVIVWMAVRKEGAAVIGIFVVFEIVAIIGFTIFTLPYGLDIAEGTCVVYEGEYIVQDIKIEKGAGWFAVIDFDDRTIKFSLMPCPEDPPIGLHIGRLVYAKHTNVLFDWEITNQRE